MSGHDISAKCGNSLLIDLRFNIKAPNVNWNFVPILSQSRAYCCWFDAQNIVRDLFLISNRHLNPFQCLHISDYNYGYFLSHLVTCAVTSRSHSHNIR